VDVRAFPGVDLVHHTDELPQAPEEHPRFWDIWRASIRRHVPGRIDYVFASEDYGERLAAELDARFVPVDRERRNVPVSGRAIRQDPMAHWDELLPPVRPYYVKRVCVCDFGDPDWPPGWPPASTPLASMPMSPVRPRPRTATRSCARSAARWRPKTRSRGRPTAC
jgi:hypothetical protein